MWQKRNTPVLL